jgi:hypothetical protein
MENNLPVTPEVEAQEVARSFNEARYDLEEKYKELRAMEPSLIKATMAKEFAEDAKRYLDGIESSELKVQSTRLYQAHRFWSQALKKASQPANDLVKYCNTIRSDWEIQRRMEVEAERLEREKQANLFAAKQREAEVAHLREIGKEGEAEMRAKAPVIPITVNMDPDAGKPEGESLVEVWVPKRDDGGNFVFTDEAAYRRWVTENVAFWHLMSHEYGQVKKLLTANRGMVQPPGLVVEHKFEPRTRREPDNA